MTGRGRLPVVYVPDADERLSSWAARMAPFYAMTVSEFVSALGLQGHDVFDLEWRLSEGQGALIVTARLLPLWLAVDQAAAAGGAASGDQFQGSRSSSRLIL